jgi:hypothetical protein
VAWRKIDSLLVGILAETTKIPTRSGYFASGERVDQVENACVLGSLCPVFREIATTRRLWFLNDVFHRVHFLGLLLFAQPFDAVEPSSVVETMPSVLKNLRCDQAPNPGQHTPSLA